MRFASFKASGNIPVEMLTLIISRRDGEIICAADFNNLSLMPSKPVALFVSNDFIMHSNSRQVISYKIIGKSHLAVFSHLHIRSILRSCKVYHHDHTQPLIFTNR